MFCHSEHSSFGPATAFGGGVHNSGSMTITNCTISGNSAVGIESNDTGEGGGISNWAPGRVLQITSSTIAHNSASGGNGAFGGGIYGHTRTDSSIIALNSASTGPDIGAGGLESTGYNIIGNNADAVINSQPTDQIGTPAAPIDPLLQPLADNGGPTLTHALQSGSPAINRGDPVHSPGRDQRGYGRMGVPDVGAFEFDGGPPRYDFNSDGTPDYVLYQASTWRTAIWYLDNNIYQGSAFGPSLPSGWALIDVADFNGDSYADYALFNHNTRQTAIWYLNNNVYIGGAYGPSLPSGWQLVAVGDFNGEGKPDYVLYNPTTRQTAIWYLNNNVYIGSAYGPTPPAGWSVIGLADFNGDGKTDYLLFNSTTRQSAIWYLNNNVYVSGAYGPTLPSGWQLTGTADFDGDGKPDYALFNATTRKTAIWYLNDNVFVSSAFGPTLPAGWSLVRP
jgi:VCBS repeat protein